jgi:hypothetical protein
VSGWVREQGRFTPGPRSCLSLSFPSRVSRLSSRLGPGSGSEKICEIYGSVREQAAARNGDLEQAEI